MMRTALTICVVAALTDHFDGKIARKQGVTGFGKFMDPLADKLLIGAALICFALFKHVDSGLIPVWMVFVIIGREVLVTFLRIVFIAKYGQVVSANQWGKYKMTSQLIVIITGFNFTRISRQSEHHPDSAKPRSYLFYDVCPVSDHSWICPGISR